MVFVAQPGPEVGTEMNIIALSDIICATCLEKKKGALRLFSNLSASCREFVEQTSQTESQGITAFNNMAFPHIAEKFFNALSATFKVYYYSRKRYIINI